MPGQRTSWAFIAIPPSASLLRMERDSPAKRLCIILQRSSGFVVCTEMLTGEIFIRMVRSMSCSVRFVRVI